MRNFLVRSRANTSATLTSLHTTDWNAQVEARRLAKLHNCPVDLFQNYGTVSPGVPEPELHEWPIDKMLDLALSRAKTSHRWTCIYGILHQLKERGITTLKAPQSDMGM